MSDAVEDIQARLAGLRERGVRIVDPRQTWVGPQVRLDRIAAGSVLHPGTRLQGSKLYVGAGAEVGTEGPATLVDAVLGAGASVASGYVEGAVLLARAKLGANAHARPGTLLEEQASTAHCVGLKHTILLSFVTLGSLINFCDCLMAGGTSREDHSEVGSGFIHFNFTPWGERGDKATPSLVGDVVRGVFLRERRIFLGGVSGLVGPRSVGYGAVVGAGQIVRRDVDEGAFVLRATKSVERELRPKWRDRLQPRLDRNIEYIAQLFALRAWYREVRLARLAGDDPARVPVAAAAELLDLAIAERRKQLDRFVVERGGAAPRFAVGELPACPWTLGPDAAGAGHVEWVQGLDADAVTQGQNWLRAIVERVVEAAAS